MKHSDPFINKIKQTLDNQQLDSDTRQKLEQARHRVLDQQTSRRPLFSSFVKPAVAFAGLGALAIAITLTIAPQQETTNMDIIESMDIITSRDDLEMYENLEFYLWLDEQIKS